jgi:hypothetical protein
MIVVVGIEKGEGGSAIPKYVHNERNFQKWEKEIECRLKNANIEFHFLPIPSWRDSICTRGAFECPEI